MATPLTGALAGVKNGDAISAGYSTTAETLSGVGTYPITAVIIATDAVLRNYNTPVLTNGTLAIGKRGVTVKADDKTKKYGTTDPQLTYLLTSGALVNGDGFTGALARTAGENVGTYPIVQGTLALNNNYAVTFVNGTLTITKRSVKIKADPKAKVYGTTDPALTYQLFEGSLVNGDAFSGSLTRDGGENVGTYPIKQGSVSAGANYDIAYVGDNLTINAWTVTGFYQPVTMGDWVYNTVKGGSTVPLKFNVYQGAANTNERTDLGAVKPFIVQSVQCASNVVEDTVDFVTTGGTTLRYDTTAHQFVQNWQTSKGAGACYRVTMETQDGSKIYAYFKTK
jgi:hypothetical protein